MANRNRNQEYAPTASHLTNSPSPSHVSVNPINQSHASIQTPPSPTPWARVGDAPPLSILKANVHEFPKPNYREQESIHGKDTSPSSQQHPSSQLVTPPHTVKRQKSKHKSSTQVFKPKQNPPFQNPAITKFSASKWKRPIPDVSTVPLIQYQGFTTTEQRLSLSKTTLEKFAAFRYKPCTDDKTSTMPRPRDTRAKDIYLSSSQLSQDDQLNLSSYNEFLSSDNHFSHKAVQSSRLSNYPSGSGATEPARTMHYFDEPVLSEGLQMNGVFEAVDPNAEKTGKDTFYCNVEVHKIHCDHSLPRKSELIIDEAPNSTAKAFNKLPRYTATLLEEPTDLLYRENMSIPSEPGPDPATDSMIHILEVPNILPPLACQLCQDRSCVEVEHSTPDSYQATDSQVLKGSFYSDAFDERLNDADLLTISLDPIIPQIPLQKKFNPTGDSPQVHRSPPATTQTHSSPQPSDHGEQDSRHGYPARRISTSELDDEYFIDEEDEQEFLKLAEPPESAKPYMNAAKNITPLASVHSAIPQLSPTMLQRVVGLPELANGQYTSNTSAQSPKEKGYLELPQVTDEISNFFQFDSQLGPSSHPPTRVAHPPSPIPLSLVNIRNESTHNVGEAPTRRDHSNSAPLVLPDSHEYEKPARFARPAFPNLMLDRSPVVGLSPQSFLRVCFRIGEMYREGGRCSSLGIDTVIELFARVGSSSRKSGTTKQYFDLLDLWNDSPPFARGVLASYKTSELAESESGAFLHGESGKMARCLGRLKRDANNNTGWTLHIINIRETDWEEIRWTRRIISGDNLAPNSSSDPKSVRMAED